MTYSEQYAVRLTSARDIASRVRDGWRICADIAASNPPAIFEALGARASELSGVIVDSNIEMCAMAWLEHPETAKRIRGVTWFSSALSRKAVANGLADIMPIRYSDGAAVIRNYLEYDALCLVVAPMDKHGFFSTGIAGSFLTERIKKAKHIYLEVNRFMPRSLTAPQIHISQVEALTENHAQLPTLPITEIDDISRRIGDFIAERIGDGACIQLGIGMIPNAVGMALRRKRHLGLHSEMLTDSMVDLLECGAVDNSRKQIHVGKTVATFVLGSRHVYDLVDDNPSIEILPSEYVNDPQVISLNRNVVSINSAVEVDFYGQVSAESIGTTHISGSGGQPDFVRGAMLSEGGQSFIAFASTANTKSGVASRIASILTPGSIVTTGKNEVDMIVTEFGVAKLRGQTLSARARNLIAIAHPSFRDELMSAAKARGILI